MRPAPHPIPPACCPGSPSSPPPLRSRRQRTFHPAGMDSPPLEVAYVCDAPRARDTVRAFARRGGPRRAHGPGCDGRASARRQPARHRPRSSRGLSDRSPRGPRARVPAGRSALGSFAALAGGSSPARPARHAQGGDHGRVVAAPWCRRTATTASAHATAATRTAAVPRHEDHEPQNRRREADELSGRDGRPIAGAACAREETGRGREAHAAGRGEGRRRKGKRAPRRGPGNSAARAAPFIVSSGISW